MTGFPPSTREEDFLKYFGKYGEIKKIHFKVDKMSGRRKPYIFVEFVNKEDAEKAIKYCDKRSFAGRLLVVKESLKNRNERDRIRMIQKRREEDSAYGRQMGYIRPEPRYGRERYRGDYNRHRGYDFRERREPRYREPRDYGYDDRRRGGYMRERPRGDYHRYDRRHVRMNVSSSPEYTKQPKSYHKELPKGSPLSPNNRGKVVDKVGEIENERNRDSMAPPREKREIRKSESVERKKEQREPHVGKRDDHQFRRSSGNSEDDYPRKDDYQGNYRGGRVPRYNRYQGYQPRSYAPRRPYNPNGYRGYHPRSRDYGRDSYRGGRYGYHDHRGARDFDRGDFRPRRRDFQENGDRYRRRDYEKSDYRRPEGKNEYQERRRPEDFRRRPDERKWRDEEKRSVHGSPMKSAQGDNGNALEN